MGDMKSEDPKQQAIDTLSKLSQGNPTFKSGLPKLTPELPMEATPIERRRYWLLMAAATMVAGHWPYVVVKDVIDTAEALLAEIERREQ